MRYRFYTTSAKAWEGMLGAITTASSSIYMEMYIFSDDTAGYNFLSELERKAHEGLRVIVVLDAIGSFDLSRAAIERLRAAGAEVRFFSYWLRRTHRKILIIDEHVAFLGGVNISKRFELWNDLQVRVSGGVVKHILQSFIRVYHECGGHNPVFARNTRIPLIKRTRLWFIEHGVTGKRATLRKHYEEHINEAKHSIVLVTPYLIPRRWLVARLHQALLRGVVVEILVPLHTDLKVTDDLNRYYFQIFEKMGARCLWLKEMNHAKVMLIDDRVGTVGSQNLDALSFDWNTEAGIFFDEPKMVHKLTLIVASWKASAFLFDSASIAALHWYELIFMWFVRKL